ncbi:hypothetical protein ACU04D_005513, partial [Escherichia coli]
AMVVLTAFFQVVTPFTQCVPHCALTASHFQSHFLCGFYMTVFNKKGYGFCTQWCFSLAANQPTIT